MQSGAVGRAGSRTIDTYALSKEPPTTRPTREARGACSIRMAGLLHGARSAAASCCYPSTLMRLLGRRSGDAKCFAELLLLKDRSTGAVIVGHRRDDSVQSARRWTGAIVSVGRRTHLARGRRAAPDDAIELPATLLVGTMLVLAPIIYLVSIDRCVSGAGNCVPAGGSVDQRGGGDHRRTKSPSPPARRFEQRRARRASASHGERDVVAARLIVRGAAGGSRPTPATSSSSPLTVLAGRRRAGDASPATDRGSERMVALEEGTARDGAHGRTSLTACSRWPAPMRDGSTSIGCRSSSTRWCARSTRRRSFSARTRACSISVPSR